MKNCFKILLFTLLSTLVFGQKENTISCKITYLPTIKHDDKLISISKDHARKIDSLISLKIFRIIFTDSDITQIKDLYNRKSFDGKRIYTISDSTYFRIINNKEIELNFEKINSTGAKSIVDILSNIIDGAPFILTAKTSNNQITLKNNFAGHPKLKELKEYLIFYFIYQDIKFCNPSSRLIEAYFSSEKFFKNLIYYLSRIESEY